MPKIRRVRSYSQVPFEANHVAVVKTDRGTFEVTGKANTNSAFHRFSPVQFADFPGALSIANYWAALYELNVYVVTDRSDAFPKIARIMGSILRRSTTSRPCGA